MTVLVETVGTLIIILALTSRPVNVTFFFKAAEFDVAGAFYGRKRREGQP